MFEPCRQQPEQQPCYPAIGTLALSNGFVHHESRRTFWAARASWSHPRAELHQSVGAILNLTIALLVSSFEYSSFVAYSISARQEDERACKRRLELSTSTLTRCVG